MFYLETIINKLKKEMVEAVQETADPTQGVTAEENAVDDVTIA